MSAANVDKMLDDLIGKPEPEEAEEVEAKESKDEEAEAETEADEAPDHEAEVDDDDDEAKSEAEADEPSDDDPKLAAEKKRSAALEAEVARLRRERRQREAKASQDQAPQPQRPAQPVVDTVKKTPAGIPVLVSEDGQSVYVDETEFAKRAEALAEQKARAVYQDLSKPTPEQLAQMASQQLESDFVSQNPERNKPIYDKAQQADNYLSMVLVEAMQAEGYQPRDMNDTIAFMHQSGIDQKASEYFPELAPLLPEFVAAFSSGNHMWKRSVLERIAAGAYEDGEIVSDGDPKPLQSVTSAPKSLARKGGLRSASPSADEKEFESLEREFRADAVFFPEKKYRRYKALGKKLGRSGLD